MKSVWTLDAEVTSRLELYFRLQIDGTWRRLECPDEGYHIGDMAFHSDSAAGNAARRHEWFTHLEFDEMVFVKKGGGRVPPELLMVVEQLLYVWIHPKAHVLTQALETEPA